MEENLLNLATMRGIRRRTSWACISSFKEGCLSANQSRVYQPHMRPFTCFGLLEDFFADDPLENLLDAEIIGPTFGARVLWYAAAMQPPLMTLQVQLTTRILQLERMEGPMSLLQFQYQRRLQCILHTMKWVVSRQRAASLAGP